MQSANRWRDVNLPMATSSRSSPPIRILGYRLAMRSKVDDAVIGWLDASSGVAQPPPWTIPWASAPARRPIANSSRGNRRYLAVRARVGERRLTTPSGLLTREHVGDPARSWNRTGEQRRSSPASGISVCRSVSSYSSATGIQTETNTGGRPNPSSIDAIWPREVSGVEAPRNGSLRVRMIDARHQHQADRYHFHSTPRRGKISRLHGHCRGGSCGS